MVRPISQVVVEITQALYSRVDEPDCTKIVIQVLTDLGADAKQTISAAGLSCCTEYYDVNERDDFWIRDEDTTFRRNHPARVQFRFLGNSSSCYQRLLCLYLLL